MLAVVAQLVVQGLEADAQEFGGGGFEAVIVEENKRPNLVRQEFQIQGFTGVTAYDGKTGWKIEPWNGKKDAEPLGEEEMRGIVEDSDLDGPLVNYKEKGVRVEYVGTDEVEGSDAYKLKVTLPSGDVRLYYMDTDYYVPIKVESKRMIRGAEVESETLLGDYKEVNGWYLAVWMALDDIGPETGPFQFIPGSHRWPVLRRDQPTSPAAESCRCRRCSTRPSSRPSTCSRARSCGD